MIFVVTLAAVVAATVLHLMGLPPAQAVVAIPVAGLAAMGAMGVLGRLVPPVRARLVDMVPPSIPRPGLVVALTGLCEALGVIGLLPTTTRPWAALGLLALLVCVYPANVRDAHLHGTTPAEVRRRILVRGAQQLAFAALAVWVLAESWS